MENSKNIQKFRIFLFLFCLLIYLGIFLDGQNNSNIDKIDKGIKKLNENINEREVKRKKVILIWTSSFGGKWWYGPSDFDKCSEKCEFTYEKERLNETDAIVFHTGCLIDYKFKNNWPNIRNQSQIYVYFNYESQSKDLDRNINLDIFPNNFFNWTMTFKKDSDVYSPYGYFTNLDADEEPDLSLIQTLESLKNKKTATWLVSNCNTNSNRLRLAQEMQKFINISIYGNCVNPKKRLECKIDCYAQLATEYKFYLAFENSICEEYVTEKYFKAVKHGMVPIVYGGTNYSEIAPEKSFINVFDFANVEELTNYIKFLDENDDEYLKYFEWMRDYKVKFGIEICDLCNKLHEKDNYNVVNTYYDIKKWWMEDKNGNVACGLKDQFKI